MRKKRSLIPSKLIRQNSNFIKNVQKNGRSCKAVHELMRRASDRQLLCFVEICFNVLKGRIPLSKKQLHRLQKQANLLRKLARTRTARSARYLLTSKHHSHHQQGRGLPAVAGVLASVLVPMLTDVIFKKKA